MNQMHRCSFSAARTIKRSLVYQYHYQSCVGQARTLASLQLNGGVSSYRNSTASSIPTTNRNASATAAVFRFHHAHHNLQHQRVRWNSSTRGSSNRDVYTDEQRKQDHKHCVELVQTRDMEGYLCGLLMPASAREAYFALRAFNVEIAGIKDASQLIGGRSRGGASRSTSQFDNNNSMMEEGDSSLASRLRMQWWRDAVAEIYETDPKIEQSASKKDVILQSLTSSRKHNPTLRSLAHAIHTHQLTHRFLRRIMEARESDLDVLQYESLRDMAQYGEDTVSSVLYLSLECVGVREEEADVVASDIGVGLGLLTALRSTGFRATQGECSIPVDLASKHDVSMDTLWSAWDASINGNGADVKMDEAALNSREALRNATLEMVELASFHLHRARENQHAVPKDGRMCLLPAVCGLQYLESLKGVDYDVLHPSLVGGGDAAGVERKRRLGLMFLLGRTWLTGTF